MDPRYDEDVIGREHPAGLLRAEIDRVTTSHGGLVLVAGEPGIGKTTLVTAAAGEARRRGALVLGAACWDSDSAPGYWPWVQVLRGLRRSADDWALARESAEPALATLLGEAAGGAAGEPADGDAGAVDGTTGAADGAGGEAAGRPTGDDRVDQEEFALHDAVTTALVAVSQHRPVVVVLDDLHWADPASMRLLRFAAQHTWFERLLLIGTYRDAEVESPDHPLRGLLMPLVAKATTLTLTGLSRDEVAALMTRAAGRAPDAGLLDEVHRRTGGNPFFVEQTARIWRADGRIGTIPPGVREAVRGRLAQLPAAVVEALTAAAVLGREFHRPVLAACAGTPAAQVDRLLDRAVTARLVVSRGGGRFAFVHDLVRETLYDALPDDDRRSRHAAVVRAVDGAPALAERLIPADLARHAHLAGGQLDPSRAAELLVAAARAAAGRLAVDESVVHFRRALEVADDPTRRVKIMIELGELLHHTGAGDEARRLLAEAATLAVAADDPVVLARVALVVHRRHADGPGRLADPEGVLREAYQRLIGESAVAVPVGTIVTDLIAATESLARRGHDDEALTFSLWARHDTTWGLGSARDRAAITAEIREVARRGGDRETVLWATALRWVALLELGDPRYHDEFTTFATGARQGDARHRAAATMDDAIIAAFRGDFARADELVDELTGLSEWDHSDFAFMGHHLRWSRLHLQGRPDEVDALLDELSSTGYPHPELLRGVTAAERGDVEVALRVAAGIEAAGTTYPGSVSPLWLRLRAGVAAASRDPRRCAEARDALRPYRGQWMSAMFGCDLSGPVDHWLALVDAAQERWDDAVAGFSAARDAADRLGARPWSVLARAALTDALTGRDRPGDAAAAAALRVTTARDATDLGMDRKARRLAGGPPTGAEASPAGRPGAVAAPAGPQPASAVAPLAGPDPARAVPAGPPGPQPVVTGPHAARAVAAGQHPSALGEQPDQAYGFRRDGPVWQLTYAGVVVHLPDAKGLRDLHVLLSRPGVDVPAVELLDPAAGPELVAARRMGGDPVLDDEAKARYRRHLERLDDEIDRAAGRGDGRRLADLDAERGALLAELRAAAGLAGRSRRLGDEAERARKTVTARIRDALRKLDQRHPGLAAHLRDTVSTGSTCRYLPPEPLPWRL
ncbi:AAA family ATPase [Micromonospora sp. LOL_025]|uniref:ATP-binding protein n=1 Tax=Micromonospora sp. LOL_025 TaxID=3345413 RepID=UPI003A889D58